MEIGYWAEVTDTCETLDPADVAALAPHSIWTTSYAEERLRWRPKKPLSILLLRVYRLATPRTLPVLPRYGGCKSWLTLEQPLPLEEMQPVLDDATYAARRAAVLGALRQGA